ncbi:MAG: hypothetical protein ACI4US_01045 [Muribaculaceae bacterium]
MKRTIFLIGSILVIVNLLFGLIISAYGCVNLIASTVILVLTAIVLLLVNGRMSLNDGYVVCLNILIPIIGLIQYLIAVFMPSRFSDNWGLITLLVLIAIEAILLVATNSISKK